MKKLKVSNLQLYTLDQTNNDEISNELMVRKPIEKPKVVKDFSIELGGLSDIPYFVIKNIQKFAIQDFIKKNIPYERQELCFFSSEELFKLNNGSKFFYFLKNYTKNINQDLNYIYRMVDGKKIEYAYFFKIEEEQDKLYLRYYKVNLENNEIEIYRDTNPLNIGNLDFIKEQINRNLDEGFDFVQSMTNYVSFYNLLHDERKIEVNHIKFDRTYQGVTPSLIGSNSYDLDSFLNEQELQSINSQGTTNQEKLKIINSKLTNINDVGRFFKVYSKSTNSNIVIMKCFFDDNQPSQEDKICFCEEIISFEPKNHKDFIEKLQLFLTSPDKVLEGLEYVNTVPLRIRDGIFLDLIDYKYQNCYSSIRQKEEDQIVQVDEIDETSQNNDIEHPVSENVNTSLLSSKLEGEVVNERENKDIQKLKKVKRKQQSRDGEPLNINSII